ncbi:hypothetical protein L2U69_16115 [Zavarzinia compransoris]|uniref:hypothetical protein n=1 Tax=Zavarzinia marina TaxID=2911065 RepID=UPI001F2407CD|nr:hypothetical protein [Zavarzinia marina]MCF4167175.1 hypothetical protein [Zavarzinia marina]
MNDQQNIKAVQRMLIGHGALLIFAAGVIGFGFLFFLMGKIALWPIPWEVDYQMPGTYDAWRMAHMEGIANGLLLWLTCAVLPLLPFGAKGRRRIALAMIVIAWTIVVASALDPLFPESRGLQFGGPLTNQFAFFLFYVGVLGAMIVPALIAYRCLRPAARTAEETAEVRH